MHLKHFNKFIYAFKLRFKDQFKLVFDHKEQCFEFNLRKQDHFDNGDRNAYYINDKDFSICHRDITDEEFKLSEFRIYDGWSFVGLDKEIYRNLDKNKKGRGYIANLIMMPNMKMFIIFILSQLIQ